MKLKININDIGDLVKDLRDNKTLSQNVEKKLRAQGGKLLSFSTKAQMIMRTIAFIGRLMRKKSPLIAKGLEKIVNCCLKEIATLIESMDEQEKQEFVEIFNGLQEV